MSSKIEALFSLVWYSCNCFSRKSLGRAKSETVIHFIYLQNSSHPCINHFIQLIHTIRTEISLFLLDFFSNFTFILYRFTYVKKIMRSYGHSSIHLLILLYHELHFSYIIDLFSKECYEMNILIKKESNFNSFFSDNNDKTNSYL